MTVLARAEFADELMDRPDVDPGALAAALDDVAAVNRWLGGQRALLRTLPEALPAPGRAARVLDVGTGSADLPRAMMRWAAEQGRELEVTGLDRHAGTVAVARDRTSDAAGIRLLRGDALSLPFPDGAFDLALLSMTLHHMDGGALTGTLRELARVAHGGHVLVGELERCLPGYLGARLLAATVWRRSPVTRHDGPLSVLRAFTPGEMLDLADDAGLRNARVRRHPLFRLVLLAEA